MRSTMILCTTIGFLLGIGAAEAATKPALKTQNQPMQTAVKPKPAPTAIIPDGFDFAGSIDVKAFNITNAAYGETSDWYFYPTYRALLGYGFPARNFLLHADMEKPGYADETYPFIKVNELYAKFQQDTLYVKLGRQVFGDVQDLLLGLQNDAVSMGFDLGTTDLLFFLAKTELPVPWYDATQGNIDCVVGFVPSFELGDAMLLKAYLLVGTEAVTVTPASGEPEDKVNSLFVLGGRYMMDMSLDEASKLGINGQLGFEFGMARDLADESIDASGVGLKIDVEYAHASPQLGFTIGGHVVYTSGDPDPAVATKCGFASSNALVGAGPGLFSKIEDGAGPLTYLDAHSISPKLRSYYGVFAFGVTAEMAIDQFQPGLGLWFYTNTDDDGTTLGPELNEWVIFRLSEVVSFYQQAALFIPNEAGIEDLGYPVDAPAPNNVVKFLVGSSISF